MSATTIENIKEGVLEGNFLLLAKAISLIENKSNDYFELLTSLTPAAIPIIGFTGPPGAGKSTLIAALLQEWVSAGKRVAILSVDPSSPFHQGAILGDRIRMKDWYLHPQVFIRSLASRGHLGGLNNSMIELTTLLQSVGFDYVLVETVGVGQSEVEVAALADTTIVVLVPEGGDEIQIMKSGLMEVADIFVVNKADRPGADSFASHIQESLHAAAQQVENVQVFKTIATQQVGIEALATAIQIQYGAINKQLKKQLMLSKIMQLIIAEKTATIDQVSLVAALEQAIQKPNFNIFEFSKQFF